MLAVGIEPDIRVEFPLFLAGRGIERDRPIVRRADIERVAHLQRRHLIGGFADIVGQFHVAGLVGPGSLQTIDVVWRDLVERRIALAIGRAAILVPFAGGNVAAKIRLGRDNLLAELAGDLLRIAHHRVAGNNKCGENGEKQRNGRTPRSPLCVSASIQSRRIQGVSNHSPSSMMTPPRGASCHQSKPISQIAQPSVPITRIA